MKHFFKGILVIFFSVLIFTQCGKTKSTPEAIYEDFNFIVANDLGRNGFYDQKPIAEQMGMLTDTIDIEFVAAVGDIHHFNGVASVNDPLWETNYEWIYNHPGLMLDWFPVLGNHEYRGNTKACLDYGKISRRWVMSSRYYTKVVEVDDSTTMRLLFLDTSPLIDKYREDVADYPDAVQQDMDAQLQFADSVLSLEKETWTVVFGHHPVYAYTTKNESERTDMQERLNPILKKHQVDFYFCGHIHNFQHIRMGDSPVEYIVNSSASRSRPVQETSGTVFCNDQSGFTVCSVSKHRFTFNFINAKGDVIYLYSKNKK